MNIKLNFLQFIEKSYISKMRTKSAIGLKCFYINLKHFKNPHFYHIKTIIKQPVFIIFIRYLFKTNSSKNLKRRFKNLPIKPKFSTNFAAYFFTL